MATEQCWDNLMQLSSSLLSLSQQKVAHRNTHYMQQESCLPAFCRNCGIVTCCC